VSDARRRLAPGRAIQGNLDPAVLFAPGDVIAARAKTLLGAAGTEAPHVFNLGHGISRHTPVEAVEELVRVVHAEGARLRRNGSGAGKPA